jgi:hypothetical protein
MQMAIKKISFTLIRASTSMELIDYMNVYWFGVVGACTTYGGASNIWTSLFNNDMFKFALPLLDPWTCQIVESDNNLENRILSSWRNLKGSCSSSFSSYAYDIMGSSSDESLSIAFSSTLNIESSNIFFSYHVVVLAPSCYRKRLLLMYMYTKSFARLDVNWFHTLLWTNKYQF